MKLVVRQSGRLNLLALISGGNHYTRLHTHSIKFVHKNGMLCGFILQP